MNLSQLTRPRTLLVPLLCLVSACSSGSSRGNGDNNDDGNSGGGDVLSAEAQALLSDWFMRLTNENTADDASSNLLLDISIQRGSGAGLTIEIEEEAGTLELDAVLDNGELRLSGSGEVGSAGSDDFVRVEVLNAAWFQSSPNLLEGLFQIERTEGTNAPRALSFNARVFRDTGNLGQSPLVATWRWNFDSNQDLCNLSIDERQLMTASVRQIATDRFVFFFDVPGGQDLFDGSGADMVLEATLEGSLLKFFASDVVDDGVLGFFADLDFDGERISGEVTLAFEDVGCTSSFDVDAFRTAIDGGVQPSGFGFLPFLDDPFGQAILVVVDPEDPQNRFDVDFGDALLGGSGIAFGADVDTATGEVTNIQPETLFYTTETAIRALDLTIQRDTQGRIVAPQPRDVLTGLAQPTNLRVFSDLGELEGIVTFDEGAQSRIAEIAADGSVETGGFVGTPRFDTFHPGTGAYQGIITQNGDQIFRVRADSSQELSGNGSNLRQTADGSVYFIENGNGDLRVLRSDLQIVDTMDSSSNPFLALTPSGSDLLYYDVTNTDTATLRMRRASVASGVEVGLALEFDGFNPFLNLAQLNASILPTNNRIVYQYTADASAVSSVQRTRSIDDAGGGPFTPIDVGTPGDGLTGDASFLSVARAMGDTLFIESFNPSKLQSVSAFDSSGLTTFGPSSTTFFIAEVHANAFTLGERRDPIGILLLTTEAPGLVLNVIDPSDPGSIARTLIEDVLTSAPFDDDSRFGRGTRFLYPMVGGGIAFVDTAQQASGLLLSNNGRLID